MARPVYASQPPVPADHAQKMARSQELFAKQVRAVLAERCLKCHGGDKTRGGFDLSTREGLLKGGDNGPAVVVGKAKDSRLYKLITHQEEPHMPAQAAKLGDSQIAQVAAWIDLGAAYDKPLIEKVAAKKPMVVTDDDRRFWAFQPLRHVALTAVKDAGWCRTPIDRFILARLEAQGLQPNPAVDRRTLIRRAYFDLLGLPPPPEEVEAFVNDPAAEAYGRLLDRLLASPHYGERWARHWLDLARYAESHGYEQDYDRPFAYHYRDFVIRALNQDLPYDTFVKWQIAGDEIEPGEPLALMATGFLAAGTHATQITKNQVEKERYDELDDKLRTIGTAMLGLTIGCARCHDHKYDPIPTHDYYRMLSTFTTTVRSDYDVNLDPRGYRAAHAPWEAEDARLWRMLKECESRAPSFEERTAEPLPKWQMDYGRRWHQLAQALAAHQAREPKPRLVKALICSEGVPAVRTHTQGGDFLEHTHFLKRGDPNQKGDVATQGFLQVLTRSPDGDAHWLRTPPPGWRTSYRRRALADWITDVDQGAGHLLARVIVNRLWQHHLGRGIVGTPSDFGAQGEKPTHPELLDWLATELIRSGWSLKHVHKLIMQSAAYAQSAESDPAKVAVDPDNRLCWRRPRHRLEAEVIRDAQLAASGSLDARLYGPGTLDPNHRRRSIYFFVKRSQLVPMMVLFDAPEPLQGMEQRPTTTIAPQALMLLNNQAIRRCAHNFADRIRQHADRGPAEAVEAAYRIALGRPPRPEELKESMRFIEEQTASYRQGSKADARELALADFCQVLLDVNEFIYVD